MDDWTPPAEDGWQPDGTGVANAVKQPEYSPGDKLVWQPGRSDVDTAKLIAHEAAGSGLVKAWSASALQDYETCAHRLMKGRVEKVEREESEALKRGNAMHYIAECHVMSEEMTEDKYKGYLPEWESKIYPKFEERLDELRELYTDGKVEVEGEWGFNKDWEPVGWMDPDVWARMKLDVLRWESDTSATCIDYKTGKKFGNEMKHATQGMIYAVGTFMRYPELQFLEVTFWYLDHDQELTQRYTREQAMLFLPRITDRATVMTSDTVLEPKPSIHNCRWCDFNKNETCEWRMNG